MTLVDYHVNVILKQVKIFVFTNEDTKMRESDIVSVSNIKLVSGTTQL